MNKLPQNLVYLIKKFGTTQAQLAAFAGVSQNSISNWINNLSSPSVPALIRIHQFFGVSLDALVLVDLEQSRIDFSDHIEEFKKAGRLQSKPAGKTEVASKNYFREEDINTLSEPDPVANWAIMGQFKEVHRKLDILLEDKTTKKPGSK